jgi:SagB-type dehydrogenase family enzyme
MTEPSSPYSALAHESASELFHEASKLRESDAVTARTVWSVNTSPAIKRVISNPATSHRGFPSLPLPAGASRPESPLADVMVQRRSRRNFSGEPLPLADLSALLHYSAGITRQETDHFGITWGFRSAPSGGALYPLDLYCVALDVAGAEHGLHAYEPKAHALELLSPGAYQEKLAAATYLTDTIHKAAVCVLMVANFPRTKFKYGERGYRFALLEAGHIAQNMLLVAESLGLGALPLGGYVDDQLNAMVGADGCERAVVYAVVVGRISPESR